MRPIRLLLLAVWLGGTALLGSGAGCTTLTGDDGAQRRSGVATVDSLDVPVRIAPTDTLTVRMFGTVGPNGCYSFDRFDVERSADRLRVTPVVHHRTGGMCTMAIVPLDETYRAPPPFEEGTLTVTVPQPDGPDVTASVTVSRDAE